MKFWGHVGLKEKISLLVALLTLLTTLVLLVNFDRFFFKPLIHPDDVLGELTSSQGQVQRRTPDMFEFLGIYLNDELGNGDSLFTGPASRATVKLIEESELKLGPNSLIVIRIHDGKFNIKIEKGDVTGDIAEGTLIEFQTEEESVLMDGSEFSSLRVSYSKQKGMNIEEVSVNQKKKAQASNEKENKSQKNKNVKKNLKPRKIDELVGGGDNVPDSSHQSLWTPSKPMRVQASVKKPESIHKTKYKAPYPKEGQVLLHKGPAQMVLLPVNTCHKKCQVRVFAGQKLLAERAFQPDQVPLLTIAIEQSFNGKIKWTLEQEDFSESGNFEVLEYNSGNFRRALSNGKNIEVLD